MVNNRSFTRYYRKYKRVIVAIARKLAGSNEALFNDLVQEGRIALWGLDPAHAISNVDAWIRQAIHYKMVDVLRRSHMVRYESLDDRLRRGEQLVKDHRSGGLRLYGTARARMRRSYDDYTGTTGDEREEG